MSQVPETGSQMDWQLLQGQFLNDINLVSMILSAQFSMVLIMKNGSIVPALKVKRLKEKIDQGSIIETKKVYLERRENFLKAMKAPKGSVIILGDKHVTSWDRFLSKIWPAKALWNVYRRIEEEYSLMLHPVVMYQPTHISAHYEVIRIEKKSTHTVSDNKKE